MINLFRKQRLFIRLGLVFLATASAIIFSSVYLFNWSYTGRDTILDAHDAYFNYRLIESWGFPPDSLGASKELNNLKLQCSVFYSDSDSLCQNDSLLFWSNHKSPVSTCDYLSYADSRIFATEHNIHIPAYVSYGDVLLDENIIQATFIDNGQFKYLITLDVPPSPSPSFFPFIVLAIISLSLLYLTVRRFLLPISLIEKRIAGLEEGDLESKIKIVGYDELATLSEKFNVMVDDIKNLLKQKERLLSDVSHELRTPLAKIRLMLALMPEHKKVQDVDRQIKVLDSLITNILLSDQMSAAYSNLEKSPTTIDDLVEQALELTFVKKEEIHIKTSVNPTVVVDGVKMSIAIKNLIENAYKYALNNEKITLHISENKKEILFLVKDRGPGIPESLLNNITKAFVRGKNKGQAGFGLGLSICYKVIAAHGGKLLISNNKRGGASFTLCIPKK